MTNLNKIILQHTLHITYVDGTKQSFPFNHEMNLVHYIITMNITQEIIETN